MKNNLATRVVLEVPARILDTSEIMASASCDHNESLDIMYLGFTLCHEGSNKNGDRFTIEELKKSWPTIAHKPINWDHEEPNIGVILDSALKVNSPAGVEAAIREPAQIDCVGAIWKARYPEFANLVAKAASDHSLSVSMEAYFSDYDYVLGEFEQVIPRDDADEDFHDLLGTFFDGKLVSRALKNVIFGAAGITGAPADKKARIWACAFDKSNDEYHQYLHDVYEGKKLSVMTNDIVIAEHEKIHWNLARNSLDRG